VVYESAITVAPYANPTANDTGANAYKPINGDTNDQNVGNPTSAFRARRSIENS
jgi:hypothetical protein